MDSGYVPDGNCWRSFTCAMTIFLETRQLEEEDRRLVYYWKCIDKDYHDKWMHLEELNMAWHQVSSIWNYL